MCFFLQIPKQNMCVPSKKQLQVKFNCICFIAIYVSAWDAIHTIHLCWYKKNFRCSKRKKKKGVFSLSYHKNMHFYLFLLTTGGEIFSLNTKKIFFLLQCTFPNRLCYGKDNNCHFKVIICISIPVISMSLRHFK